MEIRDFNITDPEFKFTFQWLIDFIKRVLADVFGFIGKEEGWDAEAAE